MKKNASLLPLFLVLVVASPGCGWFSKNRRPTEMESDLQRRLTQAEETNQSLRRMLDQLRSDFQNQQETHQQASNNLLDAQRELAESLKKELGDARAKLAMTERGLVLTFLDEIFFDSGEAVIKENGLQTLDKVAVVLKQTVPDSGVAVEGHTDNEPIARSGWRSNWELSVGRSLAVVHLFIDRPEIPPERLQAVGFGEFHPVASNETPEGRRQNRRVEIVILPSGLKKVKE